MTEDKCLCESTEILVFPCSGGSNVGQITNEAAKSMTTLGYGKMYCLAGIGGHISSIIDAIKNCKENCCYRWLSCSLCQENARACWIQIRC